jgi:hypothetical protein
MPTAGESNVVAHEREAEGVATPAAAPARASRVTNETATRTIAAAAKEKLGIAFPPP